MIFEYNNKKIYYQIDGQGIPFILLNGIMMSTMSWDVIMPSLKNHKVIRLDFLDQGQSDKNNTTYTISDQADIVYALIKHLGYEKINVCGLSYGGYVSLNLAAKYPDIVDRLLVFNSTSYVSQKEKEAFKTFMQSAKARDPYLFYLCTIPQFYGKFFYENNTPWMINREKVLVEFFKNEKYLDQVYRLAESCLTYNVDDILKNIVSKTLLVAGDQDNLFPVFEMQELSRKIKGSELLIMHNSGHVSSYEKPLLFTSIIIGFFQNPIIEYKI